MTGILKKPQEPKSLFHDQRNGVKIALKAGNGAVSASKSRTKPRAKQGGKAEGGEKTTLSGRARSLSMELMQSAARKRGSMVEGLGSFLNEKRKSIFKPKEKKAVRFDDIVVTFESQVKHRLTAAEEFEKVDIAMEALEGTNINDLEYDFEELVSHSIDSLDLELFEKLVEAFDEELPNHVSKDELEGMLAKVMISGQLRFAQIIIDHVSRHEEEYEGFRILSQSFFRNRAKEFMQTLLLTLVHQGDVKIVKLALDYGFRDPNELNAVVMMNGDMTSSDWLKPQAEEGSTEKKKKKRKKVKKKKETKHDKLLDRVEKLDLKSITFEAETVLTAALKHEDLDLVELLLVRKDLYL